MKEQIGRYRLEEELGQGVCTNVYRARVAGREQLVTLKVLKPAFAQENGLVQQFMACGRANRNVQHPYLCKVYDYGRSENCYWIARQADSTSSRQAATGKTLAHLMQQRMQQRILQRTLPSDPPFTLDEILTISRQVATILQAIHQAGGVHANLKPSNILLYQDQNEKRDFASHFMLCDSWALPSHVLQHATAFPNANPAYLSPEQLHGRCHLSPSSDLYSLAIILCQLFVGSPAFLPNDQPTSLIEATLKAIQISDQQEGSNFAVVLQRALSPNLNVRYHSADAFAEALYGARYNRIQTLWLTPMADVPLVPTGDPVTVSPPQPVAPSRMIPLLAWMMGSGGLLITVLLCGTLLAIDQMADRQSAIQASLPTWLPSLPFTLTDHRLHYLGFGLAMLSAIFLFRQAVVRVSKETDDLGEDKDWGQPVALQLLMVFALLVLMRLFDLVH